MPTFIPTRITIIGCGGTGSRLVPLLAQFIKTCAWVQNPEIVLVDDDVVEDKNLLRQNFIKQDVGKPKALVLAQRYSKAFNINITPRVERVPKYVPWDVPPNGFGPNNSEVFFSTHASGQAYILCVDSPQARRDILGQIWMSSDRSSTLVIDSGNENDFGQIVVSNSAPSIIDQASAASIQTLITPGFTNPADLVLPLIPLDLAYYRDMVAADNLSCADLDQTMAINTAMATAIFGTMQNVYYAKPLTYHRLNVSLSHGNTPANLNLDHLLRVSTQVSLTRMSPRTMVRGIYGTHVDNTASFDVDDYRKDPEKYIPQASMPFGYVCGTGSHMFRTLDPGYGSLEHRGQLTIFPPDFSSFLQQYVTSRSYTQNRKAYTGGLAEQAVAKEKAEREQAQAVVKVEVEKRILELKKTNGWIEGVPSLQVMLPGREKSLTMTDLANAVNGALLAAPEAPKVVEKSSELNKALNDLAKAQGELKDPMIVKTRRVRTTQALPTGPAETTEVTIPLDGTVEHY